MELLTNSSRGLFQQCNRKFQYMHEMGYRPVREAIALRFGTAFHRALEQYFTGTEPTSVVDWINGDETIDVFDRVKVRELFLGYVRRWGRPDKVLAVEVEFQIPLLNPATAAPSKTFVIAGKIDGIIEHNGQVAVIEHKSSSLSIDDPCADYWLRLSIDSQISGYFMAAERLGFEPTKIVYDVIHKPTIKPGKATPESERKYKKGTGELYANQRMTDESPDEYAERLREDILTEPNKYFQRKDVPRLSFDLTEYLQDVWSVGKQILHSRASKFYPKRTSECFNMGRCPFFPVCSKTGELSDPQAYVQSDNKNPELSGSITESETYGF